MSAEDWWIESNLVDQYEDADRPTREEALRTSMQFNNALDEAEYDHSQAALFLHATMRLKALGLALACDAEYGTEFCRQIATEPESFGVHEFRST